jgi:hypothetical protein
VARPPNFARTAIKHTTSYAESKWLNAVSVGAVTQSIIRRYVHMEKQNPMTNRRKKTTTRVGDERELCNSDE